MEQPASTKQRARGEYLPFSSTDGAMTLADEIPSPECCGGGVVEMKDRQSRKIRELGDALATAGILTLDQQARVLGLSRRTTWTVLQLGNHKATGLSAAVIRSALGGTTPTFRRPKRDFSNMSRKKLLDCMGTAARSGANLSFDCPPLMPAARDSFSQA